MKVYNACEFVKKIILNIRVFETGVHCSISCLVMCTTRAKGKLAFTLQTGINSFMSGSSGMVDNFLNVC